MYCIFMTSTCTVVVYVYRIFMGSTGLCRVCVVEYGLPGMRLQGCSHVMGAGSCGESGYRSWHLMAPLTGLPRMTPLTGLTHMPLLGAPNRTSLPLRVLI